VDDAADRLGKIRRPQSIDSDFGNRVLPVQGFAASFEIDVFSQALKFAGAILNDFQATGLIARAA
jgi:hypothetical protein